MIKGVIKRMDVFYEQIGVLWPSAFDGRLSAGGFLYPAVGSWLSIVGVRQLVTER